MTPKASASSSLASSRKTSAETPRTPQVSAADHSALRAATAFIDIARLPRRADARSFEQDEEGERGDRQPDRPQRVALGAALEPARRLGLAADSLARQHRRRLLE